MRENKAVLVRSIAPINPRPAWFMDLAGHGAACAIFALLLAAGLACAQSFPERPLRLIVPFPAGNNADIAARGVAQELTRQMGQPVVVENRAGASGMIAYEAIARSPPDGHVFGFISTNFAGLPSLFATLPYDSLRDLQPVVFYSYGANLLAVTPTLPVRSARELAHLARSRPGALSYGSTGNGTSQHLAMELFKMTTSTQIENISYKGSQNALANVISGQIQIYCDSMGSILPYFKSGRVKGLGVTSIKRSPAVPELPTLDESGIAGYDLVNWGGYAVPARVQAAVVGRLNTEINAALRSPSQVKALAASGATAVGGTPEYFADFLTREIQRTARIIHAAGIKAQ